MYIAPNSSVRVLRNVPLDSDYEHTIYFDSVDKQTEYFKSKTKWWFDNVTYQRHNKNTMRLGSSAEDLYNCNYLMFMNTSFSGKWFYAFIIKVEYISNEVCEVEYELDYIQTYHFNYELTNCFIERQHVDDDTVGRNTVPEKVWVGEYVNGYEQNLSAYTQLPTIITVTTFDKNYEKRLDPANGNINHGLFTSVNFYAWFGTYDKVVEFLQGAVDKNMEEGILGVYVAPVYAVQQIKDLYPTAQPSYLSFDLPEYEVEFTKYASDDHCPWADWTPRNNKLYTYPFNYLEISNGQGTQAVYKYELFNNIKSSIAKFELVGTALPPVSLTLAPKGYNNASGIEDFEGMADNSISVNYDERVDITGYPMVGFAGDGFKAWLTHSLVPRTISSLAGGAVGGLLAGSVSGGAGTPVGAMVGARLANSIVSSISDIPSKYREPPTFKGSLNGGNAMLQFLSGNFTFVARNKRLKFENALIIDDYFSRYGYAIKRILTPDRYTREEWTYVKTLGCAITGNLPADISKKISQIYDNGITFWVNPEHVGNFQLRNRPVKN